MRKLSVTPETLREIRHDMILISDTAKVAEKHGKTRMALYGLLKRYPELRDWQKVRNYNIAYEFEHGAEVEYLCQKYNIQTRALYMVVRNTDLSEEYELLTENQDKPSFEGSNQSDKECAGVE